MLLDNMNKIQNIAADVVIGEDVYIAPFVNLYGCRIGNECKIGTFVEIQKGAQVGNRCKISSHSFLCEGVALHDEVFIGHGVVFTNDKYPRATNPDGTLQKDTDWNVMPTVVHEKASIGSGAVILGGVTIGKGAMVGAGSVVTKDIPEHEIWVGNPAKFLREVD
jgi:UDP-2-acetamido-3-amino-2,3-dideoxy-glucuronate N-acetyltransferase